MSNSLYSELKKNGIQFSNFRDIIYLEKNVKNTTLVKKYLHDREDSLNIIHADDKQFYEIPNQYVPFMLGNMDIVKRASNETR